MTTGKILVAQGGGPTAVINQSLVGVVQEARRFGQIERVLGAASSMKIWSIFRRNQTSTWNKSRKRRHRL
jgi:hypothetical protein